MWKISGVGRWTQNWWIEGGQCRKSNTVSSVSPSISHEVMGPAAMILVFWIFSFKPTFSLSSFTFIKMLFSSSLSGIRVVSFAYLRLLIFLLAILIPACASSSPAFLMMCSAYQLNNFIFLGSKITVDGDCSHEIKRCLLLGSKVMTNLGSILKNRDITWQQRSI